jgi:hypothetical protein
MTRLDRKAAKNVNFAKLYGAGVRKFAAMLNKSLEEAQRLYAQYDRELPFLRLLSDIYTRRVRSQGYIALYDGARRHFDKFAPGGKWQKGAGPCALEEARQRLDDPEHPWYRRGPLHRADTYTALNALIQGSAARHTKLWMRAVWREGITPLLQMHDCLDCSVSSLEQAELVARLGCEAVRLDVPMRVDLKFGRNWADAMHSWAELQGQSAPAVKRIDSAEPTEATTPIEAIPNPPTTKDTGIEINRADVEFDGAAPGITTPEPATRTREPESKWPLLVDVIGEPLINGKIRCPFHDDHSPSLHIYDDHFHCFVCGAHGDVIDWLREREGLSLAEAVEQFGPTSNPQERTNDDAQKLVWAAQIWDQAQSIANTLAIQYLADVRKIDVNALPADADAVLRFHPRCPFGHGIMHPCLVALYRDVETDVFAGIHRIALTPKTLAGGKPVERLMLGPWPTPRAIKLYPATTRLFLGEGLETTLAAATRMRTPLGEAMRPAWAAGSAGNIRRFPVLPEVERLVLLVDHDANKIGEAAAKDCHERWKASGRGTTRFMPDEPDSDFNDVVKAKLEAAA